MPDVRKCPHCFREITPGDVERIARAEIEAGLRIEFNSLHSEEVVSAKRSEKFRLLSFFPVLLVLLAIFITSTSSAAIDLGARGFNVYPLILPVISGLCVFLMGFVAPRFLDTRKELEDRFSEFKAAHGLS